VELHPRSPVLDPMFGVRAMAHLAETPPLHACDRDVDIRMDRSASSDFVCGCATP
jgi:hypothetical protein